MTTPKDATAIYTGGGIWLFYGKCKEDRRYYMLSSEGFVLIVDEDPGKTFELDDPPEEEDCLMLEWQDSHQVEELEGEERLIFSLKAMDILESYFGDYQNNKDRLGGLFETEVESHRKSFKLLCEDPEVEKDAEIRAAVTTLKDAFARCSEIFGEYDEDQVDKIIGEGYPFDKSFDEVALAVAEWANK